MNIVNMKVFVYIHVCVASTIRKTKQAVTLIFTV